MSQMLSPMHRHRFIDASRALDDPGLQRFPTDVWLTIFRHIPAEDRVAVMLRFAERFPGLAFIFDQEPSLWMSWTLSEGTFFEQRREVKFSMNYWVRLYRSGRRIRVDEVRSIRRPIDIPRLLELLPANSLPFIRSLHLRVPFVSYVTYSFVETLDKLSRLERLKLIVQSTPNFHPDHFHRRTKTFTDHRPIDPPGAALRRLSLNNMALFPDSLTAERWVYITHIHVAFGLRRSLPRETSLYDIIHSAPNLTELSTHLAYALSADPFSETFFAVKLDRRYDDWNPGLTLIDIKGGREHVPAFVSSIINHPRAKVHTVSVTLNTSTDDRPNLFIELQSFLDIHKYKARTVLVDLDLMNIVVTMVDGGTTVRNWNLTWRLFDWTDASWPEDKLLRPQNKFRLFVSSIVLDTCPSVMEVSVDGLATSLFAMMDGPCLVDTLHLTGQTAMYEVLLHYILEHSNMFPRLKIIHLHHRSWNSTYEPEAITDIVTGFNPPLLQLNITRTITVLIESTDSRDSDIPRTSIDWILSSPPKSRVSLLPRPVQ